MIVGLNAIYDLQTPMNDRKSGQPGNEITWAKETPQNMQMRAGLILRKTLAPWIAPRKPPRGAGDWIAIYETGWMDRVDRALNGTC